MTCVVWHFSIVSGLWLMCVVEIEVLESLCIIRFLSEIRRLFVNLLASG